METRINGIKRIGIVSFSMIYLVLALTYVLLLPNYNSLLRSGYYYPAHHLATRTTAVLTTSGHHARVQKLFYSTPENKKELFTGLAFTGVAILTLFVAATGSALYRYEVRGNLVANAVLHRHDYLQFRSLRI